MATSKRARVFRMLFCDYYGRGQDQCAILIEGRDQHHICERCIDVCVELLEKHYQPQKLRLESPPATDAVDPVAPK